METIEKLNCRRHPAANNAYIAAQLKVDECIELLEAIRKEGVECENWAHAEGATSVVNDLVDAVHAVQREMS